MTACRRIPIQLHAYARQKAGSAGKGGQRHHLLAQEYLLAAPLQSQFLSACTPPGGSIVCGGQHPATAIVSAKSPVVTAQFYAKPYLLNLPDRAQITAMLQWRLHVSGPTTLRSQDGFFAADCCHADYLPARTRE